MRMTCHETDATLVVMRKSRLLDASKMGGWSLLGLYAYCVLLSALGAALASILATAPHWVPGLMR